MMNSKKRVLNVLYQSDDNYAVVSGITIASLLQNNQHLDQVNIFYCEYKMGDTNKKRLKKLCSEYKNASLSFMDGAKYHEELTNLNVKPWHGVYVTWLKLLAFGDLRLDSDRVVFINGQNKNKCGQEYFN